MKCPVICLRISETHFSKPDLVQRLFECNWIRRLLHGGFLSEDLIKSFQRGPAPLEKVHHKAKRHHGPDKHRQVCVKSHKTTQCQRAIDNPYSTHPKNDDDGKASEKSK